MGYTALIPITIICVLANHMGLIKAIEDVLKRELPVINCCKCATFWTSSAYLIVTGQDVIISLAVSFTAAYLAVWLELFFGIIDKQYDDIYEKFFESAEGNSRAEDSVHSENGMP